MGNKIEINGNGDKMELNIAIKTLERYNKWRRGAEIPQPDNKKVGIAIDTILLYVQNRKEV